MNKKVVIMGLGRYDKGSGISAALFFARQKTRVLVTDVLTRKELAHQIQKLKKFPHVRFALGGYREKDFKEADLIIKNPGVPATSPFLAIARRAGIPIQNDWSIFLSLTDNPLVGVTGTRGKTTTTTLLNEFLKEHYRTQLVGNLGISPLAVINTIHEGDIVVAELSSWNLQQLPAVKKSPHIAVVTNLLEDHLNIYKTKSDYYKDKEYIFAYQNEHDFLVANRDNAELRKRARKARSQVFWFSQKPFAGNGAYSKKGRIYFSHNKKIVPVCAVKDITLKGEHNIENVLAAVCAAMIAHISPRHISSVLQHFKGVPNRLELVRSKAGITYWNDTTATTPDATIAALRALNSKRVILLAGGTDKNLTYRSFAKEVKKYRPRLVLFAGTATTKILRNVKGYTPILGIVQSMKEAMALVRAAEKKGDIVLLSPGAASFGIFKNEFDRGAQFVKAVKRI